MLLNSLLFTCVALFALLFSKLHPAIRKLILGTLLINLLALLIYSFANYYSKNGFNYAVVAHLSHLINLKTLLQFWQAVLLFLATVITLISAWKIIPTFFEFDKSSISSSSLLLAKLLTPVFLVLGLISNPLYSDIYSLQHGFGEQKLPPLPNEFEDIYNLAPPISYTSPELKKNFIVVLAENFDASFINSEIYPGLTPSLTGLVSDQGTQIFGIRELQLSNWTDAGIAAHFCGVSMTPDISGDNLSDSEMNTEWIRKRTLATDLIGESCIGDILSQDHYELSFAGGSEFGRKGKTRLFESQGFDKLYFNKEISAYLGTELPTNDWGVHDDTLFDFSNKKLSDQDINPFGFVALTVDTHAPFSLAPSCNKIEFNDGHDEILNSVHCSDKVISEFIASILDSPEHKNTVVFLISDHLYQGDLPNNKIKRSERDYLFVVFNHGTNISNKKIIREATAFDVGPTILGFLGYNIETLNFGRNLLMDKPTLSESIGLNHLYQNVVTIRHKMRDYWRLNFKNEKELEAINNFSN